MSLTQEEWDEVSQDIPSTSDPFLQKYLAGRDGLIAQEKTSRSDASFRASLTPIARRACDIVDAIRSHEMKTVWASSSSSSEGGGQETTVFPGMMFRLAKERMESTRIWDIMRRMPKGALLHAHMDAMVDFDFLLDRLMAMPGMHMSSDRALVDEAAMEHAVVQFRYRAREVSGGAELWQSGYTPGKFLALTSVADAFPGGGRAGFLEWMKSRCTLHVRDSHDHHHGVDAIWDKFARCFVFVATIIHYEPIFRLFLRRLMSLLKADGVNWAELR